MTFGKLGSTFRGETRADIERHLADLGPKLAAALALSTIEQRYAALDRLHLESSHNQRMILVEVMMRLVAAHPPGRERVMTVVSGGE